jgi:hypothetical protein
MTREEALSKDEALAEIIEAIHKLPTLFVSFGGEAMTPNMVNRYKVIALIQIYGFNKTPKRITKKKK